MSVVKEYCTVSEVVGPLMIVDQVMKRQGWLYRPLSIPEYRKMNY